jgi:hypothetical protein
LSIEVHIQKQRYAFFILLFSNVVVEQKGVRKSGGTGNAFQVIVYADNINLWGKHTSKCKKKKNNTNTKHTRCF